MKPLRSGALAFMLPVLLNACTTYQLGHVLLGMPNPKVKPIRFSTESQTPLSFVFPDPLTDPYLKELRETYQLAETVKLAGSDQEKALRILDWTHRQWSHNGSNEPSRGDALTILKEAKDGKQFRCVEYGIVAADALQSIGLKARVLALKTRDVARAKTGAGHVLTEVWLPDRKKWALLDGQFNLMPVLGGMPLNAVEFQAAILEKKPFQLVNLKGEVSPELRKQYLRFIPHYLYYFDTSFDQRRIPPAGERFTYQGKKSLMLVPEGAAQPTVFQRRMPLDYCYYTPSTTDFYPVY